MRDGISIEVSITDVTPWSGIAADCNSPLNSYLANAPSWRRWLDNLNLWREAPRPLSVNFAHLDLNLPATGYGREQVEVDVAAWLRDLDPMSL